MQNIRTLYDEALQNCHSERSEESNAEPLRGVYPERSRRAQGDNSGVPISCSLIEIRLYLVASGEWTIKVPIAVGELRASAPSSRLSGLCGAQAV